MLDPTMRCLVWFAVACAAWAHAPVSLIRVGPYVIVDGVRVNDAGPYRFLIDTGAESSAITPEVARAAGVAPSAKVEQVTATGSRWTPVGIAAQVSLDGAAVAGVEALIEPLAAVRAVRRDIDGILGQSFLGRFDYHIDYRAKCLVLDPPPPQGERVPFVRAEGRAAIPVLVDGAEQHLVLDSGSSALIHYGAVTAFNGVLGATAGRTRAELGRARIRIGSLSMDIEAARLPGASQSAAAGLMPTHVFRSVYVSNRAGYVVLSK